MTFSVRKLSHLKVRGSGSFVYDFHMVCNACTSEHNDGSGETVRMSRLDRTVTVRIYYKLYFRLMRTMIRCKFKKTERLILTSIIPGICVVGSPVI